MTFGQNLKYLREIHHVKQDDLAAYLKVTRSAIAGYETRGKQPDYEKLIQIAKYFNVSVDYLLTGKQTDASAPSQDHLHIPGYKIVNCLPHIRPSLHYQREDYGIICRF